MPTYTWTGKAGDGVWTNALNWSSDVVPGVGNTAFIPAGAVAPPDIVNQGVIVDANVVNDDTITLGAGAAFIVNGDVVLSGTGQLVMTDGVSDEIYSNQSNSTLENQSTIIGAGQIYSNSGRLTLVNDAGGLIDGTGSTDALVISSIAVSNAGLLESTAGTLGLSLNNETINNAGGTIANLGGAVTLGGNLDITGGTLTSAKGSSIVSSGSGSTLVGVTVAQDSTLAVADGTSLNLSGAIVNNGVIAESSTGDGTSLIFNGAVVLSGTGSIQLSDSGGNQIYSNTSGTTLDNQETIAGAGQIYSNSGRLALHNDIAGVIDATGAKNPLSINNIVVNNDNLVEATGAGGLILNTMALDNTNGGADNLGQLDANGADVTIQGSVHIIGGTLSSSGAGEIVSDSSGSNIDGSTTGGAVTVAKGTTLAVADGTSLNLTGAIVNKGVIAENSTGDGTGLIFNGAVVLSGAGSIQLSDSGGNQIYSNTSGTTLDNQETIAGAGQIYSNSGRLVLHNDIAGVIDATGAKNPLNINNIVVNNDNLVEATGAGGLILSSMALDNTDGGADNLGQLAANGADVTIQGAVHIIGGTLSSSGAGEIVSDSSGSNIDGSTTGGAVTVAKGTTLAVEDGSSLNLTGAIVNNGVIAENSTGDGTGLIFNGAVVLSGAGLLQLTDFAGNQIYSNTSNSTLDNQETIEGAGAITSNSGRLTLLNDAGGVIDATGVNSALNINNILANNENILEATGAGGLILASMTLNDSFGGAAHPGSLEANGGDVYIQGADIIGGSLQSTGSSEILANVGGSTIDGSTAGGAVTITKGSTLAVADGQNLNVTGAIVNNGVIAVGSTGDGTALIFNTNAVVLSGSGSIQLSDSGANQIYSNTSNSTLDNQQTIEGAGAIYSNSGRLTLLNDASGVIDATGVKNALNINNITLINDSLVEATGQGGLILNSMTLDNTDGGADNLGQLAANGADVTVQGGVHIIGGSLSGAGAIVSDASGSNIDGSTNGGAVTIASGLTLAVEDNTSLNFTGDIINNGVIADNSITNSTGLIFNTGEVVLSGSGAIQLSDSANNLIYSNASGTTLDNQQTIEGAGAIYSNSGRLTLLNDASGVIDATGAKNALNINNITLNNNSLVEATGQGGLILNSMTLDNTDSGADNLGQLAANGADVTVQGGVHIIGGTLSSSGAGAIVSDASGSNIDGSTKGGAVTIASGSTLIVVDSTSLNFTGDIVNNGVITENSSGNGVGLIFNDAVVLSGSGSIQLSDFSANQIYSNTSGSTLDNKETIEGAGDIFSNSGRLAFLNDNTGVVAATYSDTALDINKISFTNDGVVRAQNGATLDLQSALTNISIDPNHSGGSVLTGGTYDVVDPAGASGGASVIAISGNGAVKITTLDATVDLAGATSQLTSNGVDLQTSLLTIGATGALNLYYGFNSASQQDFVDPNAVTLDAGAVVSLAGAAFSTLGLTVDSGATLASDGVFNGATSEASLIGGPIVNDGQIVIGGTEPGAAQPETIVSGAVSGTGAIAINQDGLARFDSGVGVGQTITFGDNPSIGGGGAAGLETLDIVNSNVNAQGTGANAFAAAIAGFKVGDAIDLADFANETNYNFNGATLTVNFASGPSASLNLSGVGIDTGFHFASDGAGGTLITTATSAELADDTGASATDGVTSNPALTGTGDAGVTVTLTDGGKTLGTTTIGSDGVWTFDPIGLSDGVQTVTATEASSGGASEGASITFTLATQAPTLSATPSLSGLTNQTSLTILGAALAEAVGTNAIVSLAIIDANNVTVATATPGSGGAYSATLSGLSNGAQDYTVVATDTAGNVTKVALAALDVATAKPTLTASQTLSGTTTETTDTFSGTAGAEAVTGNSIASVVVFNGAAQVGTATLTGSNWTLTESNLLPGTYDFSVVATDAAGNSTTDALSPVTITSGVAPVVTASVSNPGLTNATSETVSETATASSGNTISSVKVFDNGALVGPAVFNATTNIWSVTASKLGDGEQVFSTVTTDSADNLTTTDLAPVYVATQPPSLSATPSVSGLTDKTSVSVTGVVTAETVGGDSVASVEIFNANNIEVGSATPGANGAYSVMVSSLLDGVTDLTVEATDTANNVAKVALTEIDVATQAPTVQASESVSGTTAQTSDTITATATAENVTGDAIASVDVYDGTTRLGAAMLVSGVWTYTAANLSAGDHNFSLLTTDKAGNSTTTALAPVNVSAAQPPTITASETRSGLTDLPTDTITETATASPGSTITGVEVFDGSTALGAAAFDSTTDVWSYTASGLADGANVFSTVTTDSAGNTATTTLLALDVATAPPTVTVKQSVSGPTNQTTIALTGSAMAEAVPGDFILNVEVFDGATNLGPATYNATTGAWTFATATLAEGVYDLNVVTLDAAGNFATTALAPVDVATTAPVVKASQSLSGLTDKNIDTVTETATADAVGSNAIASVLVYDGATELGAAAFANGVWSFTTPALPNGVDTLKTVTTDTAGNVTTTTLAAVDVATTAPVVKASQSLSGLTDKNIDTVTETATADAVGSNAIASVLVYDGATELGAAALANGVWSYTTPALPNGVDTLKTVTTDTAGNVTTTTLAAVDVATTAPVVKASQSLSGLTDKNIDTVTETATADAVGSNAIASVLVYDGATELGAAAFANGVWSYTTPALPNGVDTLKTVTTDTAGNVTTTTLAAVDVATTAPVVKASQSLSGLTDKNIDTVTETATADAVGSNAIASVLVYDGATELGAAALANGVWSYTTPALPNGVDTLKTVTTDTAGNVTTTTLAAVDVATTAPVVKASQSLSGLTDKNIDTVTETATADAVGSNAIASVLVYDGATELGAAAFANDVWSYTTPALPNGVDTLRTVTTDTAGNVTTTTLAAVDVATTAPVVKASESVSGLTTKTTDTVTETAVADAVGSNAIASVNVFDLFGGVSTDLGAASLANGVWSFTTPTLLDGVHTLSTVTTDTAGNTTTTTLAPVNVEPPPPKVTVALIDDFSGGQLITNNDELAGTGDPGLVVSFTIDGAKSTQTVTANAAGVWTFTPTGLSQGAHTIVASETNGGGTGTASITFTYDTVKPAVAISTLSGQVANASEILDGTGEPGAVVQLYDGAAKIGGAVTIAADGEWSETVTLPQTGANTISATATDAAKNVGTSAAVTLTLANQIVGTASEFVLIGTAGADHITVGASNVVVTTLGGADTVTLTSTGGANQFHDIIGGGGSDTLDLSQTAGGANVNLAQNIATGAQIGTNYVFNFSNIVGGGGAETLVGVGGGDIEAGSGADVMTGGAGADTFSFLSAFGTDTITNFHATGASHDLIVFDQSLFANWAAINAVLTDTAVGAEITLNAHETLTLAGVTKAMLEANAAADFRIV